MPQVQFIIHYTTGPDQVMGITGSIKELGEWDLDNCQRMNFVRSADGNWRLKIDLPENISWEYQYVILKDSTNKLFKQESRSNREGAIADKEEVFRDGFGVERIEDERERIQIIRERQFDVELRRIAEQRERDRKLLEERLKKKEEKKAALRKKKIEEAKKKKEEERRRRKEQEKKDQMDKILEMETNHREIGEQLRRKLETQADSSSEDERRVPEEKELLEELHQIEKEELQKKLEEEKKKQEEERERKLREREFREEERKRQMEEETKKLKEERRKRKEDREQQEREEAERKQKEEEEKKRQEEQMLAEKFATMMNKQKVVKQTTTTLNPMEEQARRREARKREEDEKKQKEEEEKRKREEEEQKKQKEQEEQERKKKEEEERRQKEEDLKQNQAVDPEEEERRRRREERRKGREPVVEEVQEEDEERRKKRLEREARSAARNARKDQRKKETDAEIQKLKEGTAALLAAQEEERKRQEEVLLAEERKRQQIKDREIESDRIKKIYLDQRVHLETPIPEVLPLHHNVLFSSQDKPNPQILKFHLLNQGRLEKESILKIISLAQGFIKAEPNVLDINAPVIIFGDIHGQFFDMIKMMNLSGEPSTTQYLFLGDYVDRGYFSTEVILYLYALKISYPSNIFLLRGNHECRGITAHYNFKAECLHKYDLEVYDAFCDSFDYLPLAALLRSKALGTFLAVHGGIGPGINTIDDIRAINRVMEIPEDGPLCDLLWADPLEESSSNGLTGKALERWLSTEFRPNHTRGTSQFFGLAAVTKFLETNNLNCIVRAHEVQKHGFMEHRFLQTERELPYVITVFSAPNYCDKYENFACYMRFTDEEYDSEMMTWTEHPYLLPHFIDVFSFIFPFAAESVAKFFLHVVDYLRKGASSGNELTVQEEEEFEKKTEGMSKLMVLLKQNRMQNQNEVMPLADKYRQNLSMFDRALREDGTNELRPLSNGTDARKLSRIKSSPHVAGVAYGTKRAAVPQRQSTFSFGKKKNFGSGIY